MNRLKTVFNLAVLLAAVFAAIPCMALPSGAHDVTGAVVNELDTSNIQQIDDRAVIHWDDFSIGHGEWVNFLQPSVDASLLNLVTGANISQLNGLLTANGNILLLNPNGIIVGPDGVIDVNSFVVSTLMLDENSFLQGDGWTFVKNPDIQNAAIVNLGTVRTRQGDIHVFAQNVSNLGTLSAPQGSVDVAAGFDRILLQAGAGGGILVKSDLDAASLINNQGLIEAAQVRLDAAGGNPFALAVNNEGVIKADGVETINGEVYLTASSGRIEHSGLISASNASGDGGRIGISADGISIRGGTLDASGAGDGGLIRIGGAFQGGKEQSANNDRTQGFVDRWGDTPGIRNADTTSIDSESLIDVSGANGAGGTAVIWSETSTTMQGRIDATGGESGGFVEISSRNRFEDVSLAGISIGAGGELLLDPKNINITNGGGDALASNDQFAENPAATSNIDADQLTAVLNTGTAVTLQASNDLTVSEAITVNNGGGDGGDLTLQSGRDVMIDADITTDNGALAIYVNETAAHGVVDAQRDFGEADIIIDTGATINTGAAGMTLYMENGAGITNAMPGTITVNGDIVSSNVVNLDSNAFATIDGSITAAEIQMNGGEELVIENDGVVTITGSTDNTWTAEYIKIRGTVTKTGTSESTLTLQASNDIFINDNNGDQDATSASITSTNSALNLVLNSRYTGGVLGGVYIEDGAQIITNGGDLAIAGGAGAAGYAVGGDYRDTGVIVAEASLIDAGGGDIVIRGQGSDVDNQPDDGIGVYVEDSIITTIAGDITISGTGDDFGFGFCADIGADISTDTGDISITGVANTYGNGIKLDNNGNEIVIRTVTSGNITLTGTSAGDWNGIDSDHDDTSITTAGGGKITMTGTTTDVDCDGVDWFGQIASSGEVEITGTAFENGNGLDLKGPVSAADDIAITGTVNSGSGNGIGIYTSITNSGGGNITLTGTGGPDGGHGVLFDGDVQDAENPDIQVSTSGAGTIAITGMGRGDFGMGVWAGDWDNDDAGVLIQTEDGDITVTGTGGTWNPGDDGDICSGVNFRYSKIETTGDGSITMIGEGPTGDGDNDGVMLDKDTIVRTGSGAGGAGGITLRGTPHGGGEGVDFDDDDLQVFAGAGGVTITTGADDTVTAADNDGFSDGVSINGTLQAIGGNITITGVGGTNNPFDDDDGQGVRINEAAISTTTGNITITGTAQDYDEGVLVESSTIGVTTGNITISGTGGTDYGDGFRASNNTVITVGTGDIAITGNAPVDGYGIRLDDDGDAIAIRTTTYGNVTLTGTAEEGQGIDSDHEDTLISTAGGGKITLTGSIEDDGDGVDYTGDIESSGQVEITGTGGADGGAGVELEGSVTAAGNTVITGTGSDNTGVQIEAAITTSSGDITITGTANGVDDENGVYIESTVTNTGTGNISITGTGIGDGYGVHFLDDITTSGGNISITGTAPSNYAIELEADLNAGAGDVTLTGYGNIHKTDGGVFADTLTATTYSDAGAAISLAGQINTLSMNSRNSADTAYAGGTTLFWGAGDFDIGAGGINTTGYAGLVLQNSNVTDTGAISANGLLIYGTGNATLDNPNNAVSIIAADVDGSILDFYTSTDLEIGSVDYDGIDVTGTAQIRCGGDLTQSEIVAGDSDSNTANTTDPTVVLAAGADSNYINTSGLGAGSITTGNGRFLIYSDDPDNTTEAIPAYDKRYGTTFAANAPSTIAGLGLNGNTILYTRQPTLTFTADNMSRTYGAADPAFTYTLNPGGLIDGDAAGGAYSGSPSLATMATTYSNVGSYAIIPSAGTLASSLNYSFAYVNGTLTVNKAPLTVTADAQSKVYGDADPTFTYAGAGFLGADTAASSLTGALDRNAGENAGTYAITQGTLDATNYAISLNSDNLTITKAPVVVTADNQSKPFGADNPTLTATYSGLKNGESSAVIDTLPTLTTTVDKLTEAGSYPDAITASGAFDNNYFFSYVAGDFEIVSCETCQILRQLSNNEESISAIRMLTSSMPGLRLLNKSMGVGRVIYEEDEF